MKYSLELSEIDFEQEYLKILIKQNDLIKMIQQENIYIFLFFLSLINDSPEAISKTSTPIAQTSIRASYFPSNKMYIVLNVFMLSFKMINYYNYQN